MPNQRIPLDQRPRSREIIVHESMVRDRDGRKDLDKGDTFEVVNTEQGPRGFTPDGERNASRTTMRVARVEEGKRDPRTGKRAKYYHLEE